MGNSPSSFALSSSKCDSTFSSSGPSITKSLRSDEVEADGRYNQNADGKNELSDYLTLMLEKLQNTQRIVTLNAGLPLFNQQAIIESFLVYLRKNYPANSLPSGLSLDALKQMCNLNVSGGALGGRGLQVNRLSLIKEAKFRTRVSQIMARDMNSPHVEIFPNSTTCIIAFINLLVTECQSASRPITLILPSDAHYAWRKVAKEKKHYQSNSGLRFVTLDVNSTTDIDEYVPRAGEMAVCVFTFAHTITGNCTSVEWIGRLGSRVEGYHDGSRKAVMKMFVDAALAGCTSRDIVVRARDDMSDLPSYLGSQPRIIGAFQSGFKDYLDNGSLIFIDNLAFACCRAYTIKTTTTETLENGVAGAAHPLIAQTTITSIIESPRIILLLLSDHYSIYRVEIFQNFTSQIRLAIPKYINFRIEKRFPILRVCFEDKKVTKWVYKHELMSKYSLISIDKEPNVLRIHPSPTNFQLIEDVKTVLNAAKWRI
eukprot:1323635-Amorphochlora_amoeboformis.AAC.2